MDKFGKGAFPCSPLRIFAHFSFGNFALCCEYQQKPLLPWEDGERFAFVRIRFVYLPLNERFSIL